MSAFGTLPHEIAIAIGEMCTWPTSSEEPFLLKHLAALTRTSRWLYNFFNATLYHKNLRQGEPLDSCVLWAAENGCLGTIKIAVSLGADLNADGTKEESDYYKRDERTGERKSFSTPLKRAIRNQHDDIVYCLLDMGVKIDRGPVAWTGTCALDIASHYHTSDKVALALVRKGALQLTPDWYNGLRKLADGKVKVVQALLDVCRNTCDLADGLRCGMDLDNYDIVNWGLQNPLADVSASTYGPSTVLHYAMRQPIRENSLRIFELLLARPESSVNLVDDDGCTLLHEATSTGNSDALNVGLAARGSCWNAPSTS
ncbi:unnamed protein product, partial [Clonostachys byssicola]